MRVNVLFFVICFSLSSMAQTQSGYVKTKGCLGSNGKVIKGTFLPGSLVIVEGLEPE